MKVLIIGSGGRESTISWKISQSEILDKLYVSPGNAGTASVAQNVSLKTHEDIRRFIDDNTIDVLIVGPEQPMVDGLVNHLKENLQHNCILFGPEKEGAMLEGSKEFSKAFMQRHDIPTAAYQVFTRNQKVEAVDYIQGLNPPIVIKADGLAAGKGVVIHSDKEDAVRDIELMFEGKFGSAGHTIIIEEFLDGIEFSVFIATDGHEYILLPEAKDYKRIGDGDTGLNTGGMGSVSPVPFVNQELMEKVTDRIIKPTLSGLQSEGIPYKGFIFFGLILVNNEPYLIEYNCRMGDPETQSVFPRLNYDFLELILAMERTELRYFNGEIDPRTVVAVVVASGGYPEEFEKGFPISGLENSDAMIFQGGTKLNGDNIVTDGGRVLTVSAYGESLDSAQEKAYNSVKKIRFDGINYRSDIGDDLLKKPNF